MKRDIKFRAWDVRGEQMYEVSQLVSKSSEEGWLCFTPNNPLALAEYILLQSTGLKDKNGIDIYESDIVRILYTDWCSKSATDTRTLEQYLIDIAEIGKIEYVAPTFYVMIKNRFGEWSKDSIFCGKHGYIEVIGNLYQHPNLINQ